MGQYRQRQQRGMLHAGGSSVALLLAGTLVPRLALPRLLQPRTLQAAQAKLQASKGSKKMRDSQDEDDTYVYLPPGSSMRDPVTLPNSLSDPLDRRVYYRDPSPTLRTTKK